MHMRCYPSVSFANIILAKFFFLFSSRSIKTSKRTRPIFSHLERTSLVNKGFIIWPKIEFLLAGPTREIPTDHLTCSGNQSESWIHFILPARGFSHLIKLCIALSQGNTGNQGLPGEDGKDGQSVGWYAYGLCESEFQFFFLFFSGLISFWNSHCTLLLLLEIRISRSYHYCYHDHYRYR